MKLKGVISVPADEQKVAPALARWSANRPYEGHAPGFIGASGLGGCSRALVYQIQSTPKTDPMTESGYHSTAIGSLVHDAIQAELMANVPEFASMIEPEREWSLKIPVPDSPDPLICESSGDLYWFVDEDDELVEIKTTAAFGYKMKVVSEGPGRDHFTQLGMGMKALGIETGRLVYITPAELKGRDRIVNERGPLDYRENRYHEYIVPYWAVEALVDAEVDRLGKVRSYMDKGLEVPRTIPGVTPPGAVIVGFDEGKRKGLWQEWARDGEGGEPVMIDQGATWHCGYCDWRTLCMKEMEAAQ